MKGTRSVAVVVEGPDGEVVAALSVAAISERLPPARLPSVVAAMREQAALITRRLASIARSRGRSSPAGRR